MGERGLEKKNGGRVGAPILCAKRIEIERACAHPRRVDKPWEWARARKVPNQEVGAGFDWMGKRATRAHDTMLECGLWKRL